MATAIASGCRKARGKAARLLLAAAMAVLAVGGPDGRHAWPPAALAGEPLSGNFLAQTIRTSKAHRDSLARLVRGRQGIPPWVLNMVSKDDYIGLASVEMPVAGQSMQLFYACQPKRCAESAVRVLFSADGKRAVLRLADASLGVVLLGMPSAAELDALARPPG